MICQKEQKSWEDKPSPHTVQILSPWPLALPSVLSLPEAAAGIGKVTGCSQRLTIPSGTQKYHSTCFSYTPQKIAVVPPGQAEERLVNVQETSEECGSWEISTIFTEAFGLLKSSRQTQPSKINQMHPTYKPEQWLMLMLRNGREHQAFKKR